MNIEVATAIESTTKEKGDLLERLSVEFLQTQGYEVYEEVRITASELDLLCKHKINKRTVYVECKAYRDSLSASILTQLLGTINLNDYEEGWLISTGPLSKDAKGFKVAWENKPVRESQKLSIYTPELIISSLIAAKVIKAQPNELALSLLGNEDLSGTWTLLITSFGKFWALTCLSGGIPEGVLIFSAQTSLLVDDPKTLENIAKTDTSIRNLDFNFINKIQQKNHEPVAVIEVQHGNSWVDYRPARPQDFVGRKEAQDTIISFFREVHDKKTLTRVFAITGDSGMGKSSLIAKLRERAKSQRNRDHYFIFAVDVRAATNSNYVLSSLIECFRKAQNVGFGNKELDLRITNISEPLESPIIKEYIASLEENNQIVALVFDQFEELYSKPALFEIFEETQRLFLSATSIKSNFVLGFAWKSDATVPQSHPAYFMWHSLSDHRMQIELQRFTHDEASAAITLFEKELQEKLIANLRRQLLENTQGYPWWLKKLCIHLYDQIKSGVSQSALLDNALSVESLFTRDLQKLTTQELTTLRHIAENTPADWFEVIELSGNDVLRALIDKRLVIRRGDKLTVYWDIFREYVVSGKIPSIPLTYLPSYDSLNTILVIAKQLSKERPSTYDELSTFANISPNTVVNIIHDLVMLGIAKRDNSTVILDDSVEDPNPQSVLRRLRQTFSRHAVTISLKSNNNREIITEGNLIELLQQINPAAHHRKETWKIYANRIAQWLTAAGYLVPKQNGWVVEDSGDINLEFAKISVGYYNEEHFFIGDSSPAYALQALEWLLSNPNPVTSWSEFESNNLRNAAQSIRNLGIIINTDGRYVITEKFKNYQSALEMLWAAAITDKTLLKAKKILLENPTGSGNELGRILNRDFQRNWSESSITRIGNSLRQWAHWLILGDNTPNKIPSPLGARNQKTTTSEQAKLF